MLLPPLSPSTDVKDLRVILKTIHKKLGKNGVSAMTQYIKESGIPEGSEASSLIKEIFADIGTAASGSSRRKQANKL